MSLEQQLQNITCNHKNNDTMSSKFDIKRTIELLGNINIDIKNVVNYINEKSMGTESSLTLDSVCVYIEQNCSCFEKSCISLDGIFKDMREKMLLKEFFSDVRSEFLLFNIDRFGFLYYYYPLKTRILEPFSRFALYEGVCIDININNYSEKEEQLFFGTCY